MMNLWHLVQSQVSYELCLSKWVPLEKWASNETKKNVTLLNLMLLIKILSCVCNLYLFYLIFQIKIGNEF